MNNPKVGVAVFTVNKEKGKILIGKRKDNSLFAMPGGWLEYGETWEECGARELSEEVGLTIHPSRIKHVKTFNCFCPDINYHNLVVYLYLEITIDEVLQVYNREPEKCFYLNWIDYSFLTDNWSDLFFSIKVFLDENRNLKSLDDICILANS